VTGGRRVTEMQALVCAVEVGSYRREGRARKEEEEE
jgi:hypothetical protein